MRKEKVVLLLLFGLLLLLTGLPLRHPRVDQLGTVLHVLSYDSLGMELLERLPGQRAANLHPLGHDRGRDQLVRRDLLHQLVVSGLVEEDEVVELVPRLALRPLLLLGLPATPALLL